MSPIQWGMEFMHTYYYPGNSKGSADPLGWKQYTISFFIFPPTHSEPSNSKTQIWIIIYEAAVLPILLNVVLHFTQIIYRSGNAKLLHRFFIFLFWYICRHCLFDMTLLWCVTPNPAVLNVFLVGLSCRGHWDSGIISNNLVWEPATSYVALQNPKSFYMNKLPPYHFHYKG